MKEKKKKLKTYERNLFELNKARACGKFPKYHAIIQYIIYICNYGVQQERERARV